MEVSVLANFLIVMQACSSPLQRRCSTDLEHFAISAFERDLERLSAMWDELWRLQCVQAISAISRFFVFSEEWKTHVWTICRGTPGCAKNISSQHSCPFSFWWQWSVVVLQRPVAKARDQKSAAHLGSDVRGCAGQEQNQKKTWVSFFEGVKVFFWRFFIQKGFCPHPAEGSKGWKTFKQSLLCWLMLSFQRAVGYAT